MDKLSRWTSNSKKEKFQQKLILPVRRLNYWPSLFWLGTCNNQSSNLHFDYVWKLNWPTSKLCRFLPNETTHLGLWFNKEAKIGALFYQYVHFWSSYLSVFAASIVSLDRQFDKGPPLDLISLYYESKSLGWMEFLMDSLSHCVFQAQ